nr:platelet-activating factor receptor-like [Misgurnus anguillicaudatus]
MNISSENSSIHESNSSYVFPNGTAKETSFDMFKVVDIISVVFGFPANFYVIWLIVKGTANGLVSEFFSLNVTVCEILLCMKSLLNLLNDSSFILLSVIIFVQGIPITGRPLFQCLICFERYLAVVYPVTFLKYKPFRNRVMCAVVVWVATFCSSGVMISMFLLSISINVYFCFILVQIFLFLSFQLFCGLTVLRALKQSGPGERGREKEEENHMKRKAFHLILLTTVAMLVVYVPFIILALIFVSPAVNNLIFALTLACFTLGGLCQPILFLYRVGKLNFTKSP